MKKTGEALAITVGLFLGGLYLVSLIVRPRELLWFVRIMRKPIDYNAPGLRSTHPEAYVGWAQGEAE